MVFSSYYEKEDMSNETYSIIAAIICSAIESFDGRDVPELVKKLDEIYSTLINRFTPEQRKRYEKIINDLEDEVYGLHKLSDEEMSKVFIKTREFYREMMGILDEKGILLRARVDLDKISTRTNR